MKHTDIVAPKAKTLAQKQMDEIEPLHFIPGSLSPLLYCHSHRLWLLPNHYKDYVPILGIIAYCCDFPIHDEILSWNRDHLFWLQMRRYDLEDVICTLMLSVIIFVHFSTPIRSVQCSNTQIEEPVFKYRNYYSGTCSALHPEAISEENMKVRRKVW